jgi:hypothetical protein
MSHSTLNSDAIPELFKNFDDKHVVITKHQHKTQQWCNTSNIIRSISPREWMVIISYFKIIKYIPTTPRKEILKWYHTTPHYPGIVRTEKSIKSHLTWPRTTSVDTSIHSLF